MIIFISIFHESLFQYYFILLCHQSIFLSISFSTKVYSNITLFYFNRHRTKLVTKYLSFSNSLLTIDFYFDFFSTRARSNTPLYSATQNKSKSLRFFFHLFRSRFRFFARTRSSRKICRSGNKIYLVQRWSDKTCPALIEAARKRLPRASRDHLDEHECLRKWLFDRQPEQL